jgi:hypothetical protein
LRNQFVDLLIESGAEVDLFGKGRNEIAGKIQGLENYRFSLAIENSVQMGYWTEKLSDCILANTIPIYYGAPDVLDYFPSQSVVIVDIQNDPEGAIAQIATLEEKDYVERLGALAEAKRLLESRYHLGVLARVVLSEFFPGNGNFRVARLWTLDSIIQLLLGFFTPFFRVLQGALRKFNHD